MPQTCTHCQSSINDDDAFCQGCGRPAASANGSDVMTEDPEPAVAAVPTGGLPSWATPAGPGVANHVIGHPSPTRAAVVSGASPARREE